MKIGKSQGFPGKDVVVFGPSKAFLLKKNGRFESFWNEFCFKWLENSVIEVGYSTSIPLLFYYLNCNSTFFRTLIEKRSSESKSNINVQ